MNSYPHEFLAHPQPLMFIAGLTTNAEASSSKTRDRSASVLSTGSRTSRQTSDALDPASAASSVGLSLTSPLTSPGPGAHHALPQSPPAEVVVDPVPNPFLTGEEGEESERRNARDERDREFDELVENLRGALEAHGGKGKVWLPEQERKDFRMMLVDKGVRLPLRKIVPPSGSELNTPHSPLSPLISSSPLHPDGLIAPVWVRKHAELVPSVFVLFLRLYEPPLPPASETAEDRDAREKRDKGAEKEQDDLLIKEIGDRRRRLGERGIKLTVVLMASAATLDSPSLDPRLSYLRRASALASKASLFVLTPVPAEQLPDFVASLQEALWESAMEYYNSHAKRVRRKRGRLPMGQYGVTPVPGEKGRQLGSQGWAVRYDWKAGWFAEVRGDFETARRHYEDCWNELARMFASTQILPPRTKRWAEAKVLADCVAIRICRLLLYDGEGARVTGPFHVHLKRFGDLSRGWGIGEDTFEFWSWIARQYRIFAELLEQGLAAGLTLPPLPTPTFPTSAPPTGPPAPDHWTTPISAHNPLHTLQQPAFYYYMAATCSIHRKTRYEDALEIENDAMRSEAAASSGYVSAAPGFANEKKVDHSAIIIELFSKAYSLLKDDAAPQDSAALYVAFRIAEAYCQADQHDMAMKFFDRVSPSFKQSKWTEIVKEIRRMWYECAQRTGQVEVAARLLLEMMSPDSGVEGEDRGALQDDLMSLLRTTTPSSTEPILIALDSGSLFKVKAGFWNAETVSPANAPFQVIISSPAATPIEHLQFSELEVEFSDGRPNVVVSHVDSNNDEAARRIDLGDIGIDETGSKAHLSWTHGQKLVMNGLVGQDGAEETAISSVRLRLQEGAWEIHLSISPEPLRRWSTSKGDIAPVTDISPVVRFTSRPHAVTIDVQHEPSAYVNEKMPIKLSVTSEDDRDLEARLSVFLQPDAEGDGSLVAVGDQESKSLIADIELGSLAAGSTVERVITLHSPVAGSKMLDLSIYTSFKGQQDMVEEHVRTIDVPFVAPFDCESTVSYKSPSGGKGSAMISTVLRASGPRSLHVKCITFEKMEGEEVELQASSLDHAVIPETWNSTTSFAIYSHFSLKASRRPSLSGLAPSPALLVVEWSPNNEAEIIRTALALPALTLPSLETLLSAAIDVPAAVDLHQPFYLPLKIINSHLTESASVAVEAATADAFVWKGNRVVRIPDLLAGETRQLNMEMVAVGQVGWCTLPKISVSEVDAEDEGGLKREVRVTDRRQGDGREAFRVYVRP